MIIKCANPCVHMQVEEPSLLIPVAFFFIYNLHSLLEHLKMSFHYEVEQPENMKNNHHFCIVLQILKFHIKASRLV